MRRFFPLIMAAFGGAVLGMAWLGTQSLMRQQGSAVATGYSEAVRRAQPSVVDILGTGSPVEKEADLPLWQDPLLADYQDRIVVSDNAAPRIGSGIVWSARGDILTNYHVVKAVDSLRIRNLQGQETIARVVGFDAESDLAVIRAEGIHLPPIARREDIVFVGDIVLALGNSFGVGQSVTQGIVSGLERQDIGLARIENFIQTDAAINPGQSGGALIDAQGRLVGVTTGVFSNTGSYQGISFAIPVNEATQIARELIEHGSIQRPYLGVTLRPLSEDESQFFGGGVGEGLLVTRVATQGPAERSGLRMGDILVAINNHHDTTSSALKERLANLMPGKQATFTVIRLGEPVTLSVLVEARLPEQ